MHDRYRLAATFLKKNYQTKIDAGCTVKHVLDSMYHTSYTMRV